MSKDIIDRATLESSKNSGITKISGIVKRTLGPGGLPIIIQRLGQALDGSPIGPKITKDGVSVSEECSSPNPEEDIIIQAVKAICKKTNIDAGDGTTTAIVLGAAILNETEKLTDKNANPQLVRESVEKASKDVIESLKKMATPIQDMNMIRKVASISANGDDEIGEVIGKAFEHVGAEGVVTVDEGSTNHVTLEVVDGYQFNRGAEARNNFFNTKSLTNFEAEKASVIIYDGKLFNYTTLIPALRLLHGMEESDTPTKKAPPLLIIANEFSHEVIQFLIMQKVDGGLPVCAVRGPHMTSVRSGYYDDLAKYTGGTRLGNGGRSLDAIEQDDFGEVGKVVVDRYKTTLYDGLGDEDEILIRVDQLKALKECAESPYDAQVINDRLAALTNGVAKIGVGGQTELEIKEKYDRIEDALNASRAAIQEGIIPGGGVTLLRIAHKLSKLKNPSIGEQILSRALMTPFFQILENIGVGEETQNCIAETVLQRSKNSVYDARNKKYVDAMKVGIIDPVKVTRSALENAVSIAALLSTAGGAIIYRKDT